MSVKPLTPQLVRAAAGVVAVSMLMSAGAVPSAVRSAGPNMSTAPAGAAAPAPSATGPKRPVLVAVGAQVSGTVLKIDVAERGHVTAGAVLAELNPAYYRMAAGQARSRLAALRSQIAVSRAALASGQRRAASGVTAAVDSVGTMPPVPALPPVVVPQVDAATKAQLAQARRQIVAARSEVLKDAQSEAASAGQTLGRDQALLAQGLIAPRQLETDRAAYSAAQAQVAVAQSALHQSQSGSPGAAGSIAQVQVAIAAAQRNVRTAQADAAAAKRIVDRDTGLAAQGAVAVRQISADEVTRDAADARAKAAAAELQRAQAQLVAAKAEAVAADASRRQAEVLRRAQAARAQHAAQTRVLAQQAASNIATAAQRAQALASLETEAVTAEADVQRAEADLAETVVRAPADGWVDKTLASPGRNVRADDAVAVIAVNPNRPPHPAAASAASAPAAQDRARLAQIASSEHEVLAELNAEAASISAITAAGIPEVPPVPGAALSPVPYPAYQSNGTLPTLLNGRMPWPVAGAVTSGFGWRIHPIFDTPEFHTGVDIAASMGTPIEAPAAGTVIFAGSLPANGTLVILDHGSGITTTYSHLSACRVYVGEHVQRGQIIAQVGSTGWSTGPHLFFEIRKDGHAIDPLSN
ncbi:MAG TPA: peptidoglycan DD-metalloendopeptidase family protein [bacterium]|nr:peptidoglycan DD-metalloendopeptidase family protein [bacterium]